MHLMAAIYNLITRAGKAVSCQVTGVGSEDGPGRWPVTFPFCLSAAQTGMFPSFPRRGLDQGYLQTPAKSG